MRTSRIAKETATVIEHASQVRRLTRSSVSSTQHLDAKGSPFRKPPIKHEVADLDDTSSLSSAPSRLSDIEDALVSPPHSRKRKRNAESSPNTTTTISTSITTTNTPANPGKVTQSNNGKTKKAKRQPAKAVVTPAGEVAIHPPANWEKTYAVTQAMRSAIQAPVDWAGCESAAEDHRSPRDKRFQTLIALMLSSQTKDTTNALTMKRLQTELPRGLTLESILAVDPALLNELIWAVGFHNNKTRFIKAAAEILRDEHHGDIPDTIQGLVALPGVGPKMAYLCMSAAWGRTEGIGVDVHVHRITNLWGWHKTRTPEETRATLEAWLPREKWHEINHLLVGFGQTICTPVGRDCGSCRLSAEGLCPSAVLRKDVKRKVKREEIVVTEGLGT